MNTILKRGIPFAPLLAALLLAGCGVSESKYDALQAENTQLQQQTATMSQQIATDKAQISRLQGAIKYTVNSDLLFSPGGWQMSERGKHLIAKLAMKLAPSQENKIVVNGYTDNTPIGPALLKQGITTNQELSQKRAENVMQFIISQGVKPELISAQGFGDADPVASNDTSQGRAKNRRVELTLGTPAA
jgi:chemotaxis protein MotB